MKRLFQWFAALCFIAIASTAMAADPAPVLTTADPVLVDDNLAIAALTYTLEVTITGLGRVESNPEGIDCNHLQQTPTGTCQYNFPINTVVALVATYPEPDENGSYFFCGWDGDYDNSIEAFGVLMDGAKSVSAQFCALGVPPIPPEPPPATTEMYGPYLPVSEPVTDVVVADMKPIALVERDDGGVDIIIGLRPFNDGSGDGVDIYVGLAVEGVNDFFIFDSTGGIVSIYGGLTPWKTNVTSMLNEEPLLEIPGAFMPLLPPGLYHVFLMATPTGSTASSYTWVTYFENLPFLINPLFLTP